MILDKGAAAKTERSKCDLARALFYITRGSVHYHLQCALFAYTGEMLVPLTLYVRIQREPRTRDNARDALFLARRKIFSRGIVHYTKLFDVVAVCAKTFTLGILRFFQNYQEKHISSLLTFTLCSVKIASK